jgi:hypothetical protein
LLAAGGWTLQTYLDAVLPAGILPVQQWLSICIVVLRKYVPDVGRRLKSTQLLLRPFPSNVSVTYRRDGAGGLVFVDATWKGLVSSCE